MIKNINLKTIITNLCCFVILFFPFNSTIANKIYPKYSLTYISVTIAILVLVLLGNIKRIKKTQLIIFGVTLIIALVEVVTNKYVGSAKMFLFTAYLFLPFAISINQDSIDGFKKILKLFAIEHLFFTYLATFFSTFYASNILPFLDSISGSLAISHFNSGFNPGLTTHYSTNGMYLSIFCIFFFSNFLCAKNKKNFIILIIALIGLLLVGKRGAAIFTIIACIIMYFVINKKKISNKIFNFTFLFLGFILILYISSSFIPQVTIVFDRFMNTIDNGGDLMTGRGAFYELAFSIWKNNIFFGNGWGAFSNYYQIELYTVFGVPYLDAHNVYIQLLCEMGLVGATLLIGLMLLIAFKTFKRVREIKEKYRDIIIFSFGYQVFFLLYCFSGNPLYDAQCYVIYFICIGIYLVTEMLERSKKINEKNRNSNI